MKITKFYVVVVTMLALFSSCYDTGCMNPLAVNYDAAAIRNCSDCCIYTTNTDEVQLHLQLNHLYNNAPVSIGTLYNLNGRMINISSARMYFSALSIDGINFPMKEDYAFVDLNVTNVFAGNIASGTYQNIAFNVGVKEADNHSVPNSFGTDHPLSPKLPTMFENVAEGYYFLEIMGQIDTNTIADGIVDADYRVELLTDAFYTPINLSNTFEVPPSFFGLVNLQLNLDYFEILAPLDIMNLVNLGQNTPAEYSIIATSLSQAIELE